MIENSDHLGTHLERWHQRFERALSFYSDTSQEDGFDLLVPVVVTSAYVEALLYMAMQFDGVTVEEGVRKTLTLGMLADRVRQQGELDEAAFIIFKALAELRNALVHDLDARLDMSQIEQIRALLPEPRQETIQLALRNILGGVPDDVIVVLVLEQIGMVAYDHFYKAWQRAAERPSTQ